MNALGAGGIEPVPFFIEWASGSPHPSADSPPGCELQSLEFQHPDSGGLGAAFKAIGIDGEIRQGTAVRLSAVLKTPKGTVELS